MRIAIDLTSLNDNLSGMERYAMELSKDIISLYPEHTYILIFKNEIHPLFRKNSGPLKDSTARLEYKIIKGNRKLIINQLSLPLCLYTIKADRYLFPAFPSPLLFRKSNIYNVIFDLTCWDCPDTMKSKAKFFFRCTLRNAVKVSKHIFVISHFTKNRVIDFFGYPENKLSVIPPRVSENFRAVPQENGSLEVLEKRIKDKQRLSKKYSIPEEYILCLGTLEPRKNLQLLIKAYKDLCDAGQISTPLVLAGRTGWKMDEFFEELGLTGKAKDMIHITGFVDDEDLCSLYSSAHYFVFPSLYEGFGIPPLEALSVSTAVLSSDAASLPEVLEEEAIYFESNNVQSLKEKLLYMEENYKTLKPSLNARQIAEYGIAPAKDAAKALFN